jgi:hypothetical protein
MRHEKVEIEIKGRRVKVDREIAPLVQALNELPGVDTVASHQESADTRLAFVKSGVSDAQGCEADDALVCRVLRGIEAALRRGRVWARATLDLTPDYPLRRVACDPENVMRVAQALRVPMEARARARFSTPPLRFQYYYFLNLFRICR